MLIRTKNRLRSIDLSSIRRIRCYARVIAVMLLAFIAPISIVSAQTPDTSDSATDKPVVDKPGTDVSATKAAPDEEASTKKKFVIVEGQVTDQMGAGQVGVVVTVRRKRDDGKPGELLGEAKTDSFGDFEVRSDTPVRGDFVVTLSKEQFAEMIREVSMGDDDLPPYLAETLEGNLVVIGRVVDARTSKPVAGADVTLSSQDNKWEGTTNDDGEFTLEKVVPGSGELVVEAKGYGRERQRVARLEDFGELLVEIKPERIVHLVIVDDRGVGIPKVTIEALDQPRDDFRTVMTDKEGAAVLRGVHFDAARIELRLSHEDYVSSVEFDRDVITPEHEVESTHKLVMPRAGRVSGLIVSKETDDPLGGARVTAGDADGEGAPRDWADYQGRFTIHSVPPGPAVVTVYASEYAPDVAKVTVVAGKTVNVNFKLESGKTLTGLVVNDKGDGISNAYVEATKWRGDTMLGLIAMTDSDGLFTMEGAPSDEFTVVVSGGRGVSVTKTVRAGNTDPIKFILEGAPTDTSGDGGMKVGEVVTALSLTTLEGESITMADLKGKVVLLDFWATWCGPCVAEIPHLLKVHEKFGARKDFVMISVSLDGDEKALKTFIKKQKMTWKHVFGEVGGAPQAATQFGVVGIPAIFVLDGQGKIVATDLSGGELETRIEKILGENGK